MSHILSKSSHRIRWHGRQTLQPPWSMYPYNNSTSNPITPLPLYGKPPTLAASIIGRDDLAHYLPFSPFQMASESSTVQPFQMAFESRTYQCSTTFESTTFGIDVQTAGSSLPHVFVRETPFFLRESPDHFLRVILYI